MSVSFGMGPLKDWFMNHNDPTPPSDEWIREQAVTRVDARAGYTLEFAPSAEAHREDYNMEEDRLRVSNGLKPIHYLIEDLSFDHGFYLGDQVEDNEGDKSIIENFLDDGRLLTDRGWTYWPNELTRVS